MEEIPRTKNNSLFSAFVSDNKESLVGLLNGIVLAFLSHLCAYLVIVTYAAVIFKEVGVKIIDPYHAQILLGVLPIVATMCSTKLSDTLGRNFLLILSLFGSAFGQFTFAAYSYLKHVGYEVSNYDWAPVVSLSIVIFMSSTGVVPLIYLCIVENMPLRVCSFLYCIDMQPNLF